MKLNLDLSSLAMILWCGMAIIAGSIWVLASQVRKVADILEQQTKSENRARQAMGSARTSVIARERTVSRPIAAMSGRRGSRSETQGAPVRR